MTKTLKVVGLALITVLPLLAAAPAHAAETTTSLADGIKALPVSAEQRAGYERSKFKHWVDADKDSCNTRAEVLLEEAVTAPAVGAACRITGGTWRSCYDDTLVKVSASSRVLCQ
jgi:hypothetical protein